MLLHFVETETYSATVGVITYERPTYLARLLSSLERQTRQPAAVVVVDDSETRQTERVVEAHESGPLEIDYRRRESEAPVQQEARNLILDVCETRLVCFLDDDVVCPPEWLDTVVTTFRETDAVGVGGPAFDCETDTTLVEPPIETDESLNTLSEYGEVSDNSGRWQPSRPVRTDLLRGANMSFRRAALESVGGFDESYRGPAVYEEWDPAARLRRRDEALVYHPDAFVYHFEAPTGGSRGKQTRKPEAYWYGRNAVVFRANVFPDVFLHSVVRLCLTGRADPPSVPEALFETIRCRDPWYLNWIWGYVDGLRDAEW